MFSQCNNRFWATFLEFDLDLVNRQPAAPGLDLPLVDGQLKHAPAVTDRYNGTGNGRLKNGLQGFAQLLEVQPPGIPFASSANIGRRSMDWYFPFQASQRACPRCLRFKGLNEAIRNASNPKHGLASPQSQIRRGVREPYQL